MDDNKTQFNPYFSREYGLNTPAQNTQAIVANAMKSVYLKMTVALAITGLVSFLMASSYSAINFIISNQWIFWVSFILQLIIVFSLNKAMDKLGTTAGNVMLGVFAVLMATTVAPIFLVYTGASIAKTFFITAGTFGAMSIYGYTTNQDLSKIGNILFMALIGLIIASLVNMFLKSDTLGWIVSIAGVLIFVGLTAWDTQAIKRMAQYAYTPEMVSRISTIGALNLYLDFINLFLYLLRFFGNRR